MPGGNFLASARSLTGSDIDNFWMILQAACCFLRPHDPQKT